MRQTIENLFKVPVKVLDRILSEALVATELRPHGRTWDAIQDLLWILDGSTATDKERFKARRRAWRIIRKNREMNLAFHDMGEFEEMNHAYGGWARDTDG